MVLHLWRLYKYLAHADTGWPSKLACLDTAGPMTDNLRFKLRPDTALWSSESLKNKWRNICRPSLHIYVNYLALEWTAKCITAANAMADVKMIPRCFLFVHNMVDCRETLLRGKKQYIDKNSATSFIHSCQYHINKSHKIWLEKLKCTSCKLLDTRIAYKLGCVGLDYKRRRRYN